jgi:hypothetical protein
LIGRCAEVTLACGDVDVTRRFFESAGFLATGEDEGDVVRLNTPGITLGLRPSAPVVATTLRFAAEDARRTLRLLEDRDIHPTRTGDGYVVRAPEGTRLIIR